MAKNATTVSGSGTALVPYDVVNFSCSVSCTRKTGLSAKKAMAKTVADLVAFYEGLAAEGQTLNKRSSMKVAPTTTWNGDSHEFVGYKATFKLDFSSTNVGDVTGIHDKLTSIEGVAAAEPSYGFTDPEVHRRKALELAWKSVTERLDHQCQVLGVSKKDLLMTHWNVNFNDHRDRTPSPALGSCIRYSVRAYRTLKKGS